METKKKATKKRTSWVKADTSPAAYERLKASMPTDKKLSKAAIFMLKNAERNIGKEIYYDMRAVMK